MRQVRQSRIPQTKPTNAHMKIILADDDAISRKIIAGFLARFGYQVQVVKDGTEAWNLLQTQSAPQLAIFDWMMPGMSGLEVCSRVRAQTRKEQTYIIHLSSRNSKLDIVKGLEAGADDYLIKPCDLAELQARLRVAERTLTHEAQLRKHINELENLVRRHNLLGSIAGQHQVAGSSDQEAASEPAPALAAETGTQQLKELVCQAFEELGLGVGNLLAPKSFSTGPDFEVMLPLYFPKDETWLDLRFEFDRRGAHGACRSLLKRSANSPRELQDVLLELIHLLTGTRALTRLKQSAGMFAMNASPIANPGDSAEIHRQSSREYGCKVGELECNISEFATKAPIVSKAVQDLQSGEIVAEPVIASETSHLILLGAGDILNLNRISHLEEDIKRLNLDVSLKVVTIPDASRPYVPLAFD
jgi:CheY-like chemotaxis protein